MYSMPADSAAHHANLLAIPARVRYAPQLEGSITRGVFIMGVNYEMRGGISPRLKTLSVALSLALAGGAAAIGVLGSEPALAGQKHHAYVDRAPPAWVPKAAKLAHRRMAGPDHIDVQKARASVQAFLSRTPHFDESKPGTVIHVTQLADSGEGSLRDALGSAHDGDVVDLSGLSGRITLTNALTPASSIIIRGPGSEKLTLDGGGLDRVIASSHDLKISDVTIANGAVSGQEASGGCLNVSGYLYLAHTTISHCSAGGTDSQYSYGGGVYVKGSLYMYYTQLTQNSVTAYQVAAGGGAFVQNTGTEYGLLMRGSTIGGNTVTIDSSVNQPTSVYTFGFGGGVTSNYTGSTNTIKNFVKYSTITNNSVTAPASTYYAPSGGGGGAALFGTQAAYLIETSFSGNSVAVAGYGYGGGVAATNVALIAGSQITGNQVSSTYFNIFGGGSATFGETALGASTVSGNTATSACYYCRNRGGGVYAKAISSKYSEFSDNAITTTYGYGVALGGGLYSGAQASIEESTISRNSVTAYNPGFSEGGGAFTVASAEFDNSTIAFNSASGYGGGIELSTGGATTPTFTLQSSIVSNNNADALPTTDDMDSYYAVTVAGSNDLVVANYSTVTLPGDTLTSDPKLLPLAKNGGPTRTHALDPTSPAVDAGSNPNDDDWDQRGPNFPRMVGAAPDIGAYELDSDRIFYDGFEF